MQYTVNAREAVIRVATRNLANHRKSQLVWQPMFRLQRGALPRIGTALWCNGSTGGSNPPGPGSIRWQGDHYDITMIYTVYLKRGIYYQTGIKPGDKMKRVTYKDKWQESTLWVKDSQ